jgi:hypothetical protein
MCFLSIYSIIFQSKWHITSGCLRRFFVRDKGIAKQFQRTKKCGGAKMHKGRSPTAFLRSPSPEGAKRKQLCYATKHQRPVILLLGTFIQLFFIQ